MKRVTVSVPDDVEALAKELAEQEGQSVSSFFAEAVEAYAREKRRRQAAQRVEAIIERTTVQSDAVDALHRERRDSDRSFPQNG
jgi:metal-responsive CopG/Arc/MetJ family transcriptional regulator